MGCGGSRAAEEKYTITYSKATPSSSTDDDSSNSNSNSNSLTAAQSAFTQRSSHVSKMQPAPNSRKSMSSIAAEPSAASALLKSSVKRKFGTSVKKISANNAFAKAGARRNTRSKRKKTSQYGWLAKDMHIGPGCTFAKFDVKRVIGTGLMGQVVLAEWKKDETWCAIKCVKKDYICRHDDGRHIQAERKLLENAGELSVVCDVCDLILKHPSSSSYSDSPNPCQTRHLFAACSVHFKTRCSATLCLSMRPAGSCLAGYTTKKGSLVFRRVNFI